MSIKQIAAQTPLLKTPRLTLRKIIPKDTKSMFLYAKNPLVTRYLTWNPHKNLRYTRAYINLLQEKYQTCEFYDWGIHDLKDKFIGTCGFTQINETEKSAEIGYVLNPDVWGLGYAAEAANAIMKFGFEIMGLNRIYARFILGNIQSERVMQKIKMKKMGVVPEPMFIKNNWCTVIEYSISRSEFYK